MEKDNDVRTSDTYSPPGAHAKDQSANNSTSRPITSGSPLACSSSQLLLTRKEAGRVEYLVLRHIPLYIVCDQILIAAHVLWGLSSGFRYGYRANEQRRTDKAL